MPQGFELVIYGDSIAETLRGTDHGLPCFREGCPEGPGILRSHFSDRWRTGVIATGGATSSSLRSVSSAVLHGSQPLRMCSAHPARRNLDLHAAACNATVNEFCHFRMRHALG